MRGTVVPLDSVLIGRVPISWKMSTRWRGDRCVFTECQTVSEGLLFKIEKNPSFWSWQGLYRSPDPITCFENGLLPISQMSCLNGRIGGRGLGSFHFAAVPLSIGSFGFRCPWRKNEDTWLWGATAPAVFTET